tara:strand:- start:3234 stop:3620 length:387 start_codon:yes stop_codon:yes gene_type:complete
MSIGQNRVDAKRRIRLDRWDKEKNPLKFYRNALFDTKRDYKLSKLEMEFLIFIYDEGSFSLDLIYNNDYFRCSDKFRKGGFLKLQELGHVFIFQSQNGWRARKANYRISFSGKAIVSKFYKRLNRIID